ncbi:hypothetical protein RvY_19039-2 [Ramazzottius varieornatus]|uniref:Peptidase S1 domain-containing protein n=1 Tax=Ramazzottius varieornatus TaxID=947166 RepID=A0A1D1WC03_RAMVA|nr:hypothetical protein RvY_19039-2 [Ramazzottius varieornatus]
MLQTCFLAVLAVFGSVIVLTNTQSASSVMQFPGRGGSSPKYFIQVAVAPDSEAPCVYTPPNTTQAVRGVCFGVYVALAYCPSLKMQFRFGICAEGDVCCFVPPNAQLTSLSTSSRSNERKFCGTTVDSDQQDILNAGPNLSLPPAPVFGITDALANMVMGVNSETDAVKSLPSRFARILGGNTLSDVRTQCWIAAILSENTLVGNGALVSDEWVITTATTVRRFRQYTEDSSGPRGPQRRRHNNVWCAENRFSSRVPNEPSRISCHRCCVASTGPSHGLLKEPFVLHNVSTGTGAELFRSRL